MYKEFTLANGYKHSIFIDPDKIISHMYVEERNCTTLWLQQNLTYNVMERWDKSSGMWYIPVV